MVHQCREALPRPWRSTSSPRPSPPTNTSRKTLAKAFTEITGIKVKHDLIQEGDVVEKIQTQMQSGRNVYDGWINDSDLIGTHFRYQQAVPLTDWMAGEGKDVTLPTLDVDDFIGRQLRHRRPTASSTSCPTSSSRTSTGSATTGSPAPTIKDAFKAKYGYELGVPVNWSAYEDIAEFFTNDVKEIDGVKVYGHMDYGKKDPSLGWRFTDAWLSMAGNGDKGLPERQAGRRMGHPHGRLPPGRLVGRARRRHQRPGGGLLDRQVCRVAEEVRPAGSARGMTFSEVRPGAGAGQHRPADLLVHRLHRRHGEARPAGGERRRHAEVAHGAVARTAPTGRTA